jgi:hypothetical protein
MVSVQQVREALSYDVARYGDGSNVLLSNVVADGRRLRRTSTTRRIAGGVTALAVGGAGAFALVAGPAAASSWALAPAPDQVNQRIVEIVEDQLPAGVDVADVHLEAYVSPPPGQGSPEAGGIPLPRSRWSNADAWRATITLDTGATVQVFLGHSGGETEGDSAASCGADVDAGYYTVCDADSVTRQGEDVEVIWREGTADRTADGMLYGPGTLVAPDGEPVPASTPVVTHEFETQPGGDFLVSVQEISPGNTRPTLDRDTIADIALNPELLNAQ